MQSDQGSSPESRALAVRHDALVETSSNGGSTPCIIPGSRSAALVSVQRQQMTALAKAGQENVILTAVRKQMEVLEDKLSAQIVRVQQQGDKLRESAFTRYDGKLGVLETHQPRVDRRLAEVTGNLRGLSDEMQNQIRRIDQTDSRLYEWRHQLEEEIRAKFNEIEQNYQHMASTIRVQKTTTDELYKKYNQRLLRLEAMMEERVAGAEDTNQSILQLHTRLTEVEDAAVERARQLAITLNPNPSSHIVERDANAAAAGTVTMASLEGQVADLVRQVESMQADNHELTTQVESQDERYKSLRTLSETKEEQYRLLIERLERDNVDGRIRELQASVKDMEAGRQESLEQIEILQRRLDNANNVNDELSNCIRRLQERSTEALVGMGGAPASPGLAMLNFGEGTSGEVVECAERLKEIEDRVDTLGVEVQTIRADQELGSRVAVLVGALKDVAPKVIGHDSMLKQLQQDLGEAMNVCTQRHKDVERNVGDVRGQLDRLRVEVTRLISEVEGPDIGLAASTILEQPLAEEEAEREAVAQPSRATE